MAQPFVPGPAPVWVGRQDLALIGAAFFPATSFRFLGFSAGGVDLALDPQYSPHNTDAGAAAVDSIYQGATGTLSATFSRWDEEVYAFACDHALPAGGAAGSARGREPAGRAGTVMALEKANLAVIVAFPYSAPFGPYAKMPAGYRFLNCVLEREGLPERGSKPALLSLSFRCARALHPSLWDSDTFPSISPARAGGDLYVLYDHDLSAVAGKLPD